MGWGLSCPSGRAARRGGQGRAKKRATDPKRQRGRASKAASPCFGQSFCLRLGFSSEALAVAEMSGGWSFIQQAGSPKNGMGRANLKLCGHSSDKASGHAAVASLCLFTQRPAAPRAPTGVVLPSQSQDKQQAERGGPGADAWAAPRHPPRSALLTRALPGEPVHTHPCPILLQDQYSSERLWRKPFL